MAAGADDPSQPPAAANHRPPPPAATRAHRRRIFISYRRGDAQWFAGRLADALGAYFGDGRVFRDIEGIDGGADFGAAIHDTLTAADAVIVVIGRHWLDARDDDGRRRLERPDDWVAQEVGTALAQGVPVYPVLVDDTPMPRADELPPALQPLTRFNAITISDSRWEADTLRLGRIISLDIPPLRERRLQAVNLLCSSMLAAALGFTLLALASAWLQAGTPAGGLAFGDLFASLPDGRCRRPPPDTLRLLASWQMAPLYLALTWSSALLFSHAGSVSPAARRWFGAAAWLAALGTLAGFLLYFFACAEYEAPVIFAIGAVAAPLVLALMSLSGFRAR